MEGKRKKVGISSLSKKALIQAGAQQKDASDNFTFSSAGKQALFREFCTAGNLVRELQNIGKGNYLDQSEFRECLKRPSNQPFNPQFN